MRKALLTIPIIILASVAGCAARPVFTESSQTGQNMVTRFAAETGNAPAQIAAPGGDLAPQPAPQEAAEPVPTKADDAPAMNPETHAPASTDVYRAARAIAAATVYLSPDGTPDWNASGIVYAVGEGLQVTAEQPDAPSRSLLDARNYSAQDPNWQPGDGRIIFQKKEGTHWEIFSINPDGSGLQALTRPVSVLVDELPQNVSPAWSPDGRSVVYLSNREADGSAGKWRIWVMDADGGDQRPLDPDILGQIQFRYDNSADQMIDWS